MGPPGFEIPDGEPVFTDFRRSTAPGRAYPADGVIASGDVGEIVGASVLVGLPGMEIGTKRRNSVLPLASIGISPGENCIDVDEFFSLSGVKRTGQSPTLRR